MELPALLPERFAAWFAAKGWRPRRHQLELLKRAEAGGSTLLIAPTGAGKTLAGFLPSLTDLDQRPKRRPGEAFRGVHTLYISPLKALAVDIHRNLSTPIGEIGLDIDIETRTGDTPSHRRQRQKLDPPDILLTTPEQVSLLIASKDATRFFRDLRFVIFDELHSLVTSKRGHLLSLALARLNRLAPGLRAIGLSATVAEPADLCRWLVPQGMEGEIREAGLIEVAGGAKPEISILKSGEHVPWSGHSARYAMPEIYEAIRDHRTTLLFVNTRSQAELLFQELWRINEATLPIALHHGSLDVGQRRKVEAAMAQNGLRAIVATSTLDLGIDWGDVDLVVHVGAPKGASRLAQRIGRSNHRMDEPSKAILIPANRFEVLECQAALDANYLGAQDTPPLREGSLDVLAQHVLGMAVAEPFQADALYAEVTTAAPYAALDRADFDRVVDFVATGGYALRSYERYAKIRRTADGSWRISHPRFAQQYRLNAGTILEAPMLEVRLTRMSGKALRSAGTFRGGRKLGKIEEGFLESLGAGDTFIFAGRTVRFEGIHEATCFVSDAEGSDARVPAYAGGKFPFSTYLADQVRQMLADPGTWQRLPQQVADWLAIQRRVSVLPGRDDLLIETFPRGGKHYLIAYPFEGRLAHQTLGMLLTRRMERSKARPLGFVATDYALGIWGLRDFGRMIETGEMPLSQLFDEDMLGDDLETWLDESFMLKRTFRHCATIAGLIEKRHPGQEKTGRQMTVSSDLIYDVLREHEPDHILLQATRQEAAFGLLDVRRLGDMLKRIKGHLVHRGLDRISPLAVPIMLEVGRETIAGEAEDALLAEAADELFADIAAGL
ncbi:MAG: ligase-associated DNA damage response DEXH box helicase [Nitratireductor sp.]|nr:ligase-associated DNA damage response DEXH box helicase [Nitratireductor sp.]